MFEDNKVVLIGKADDEVDAAAEGNNKQPLLSPETRTGQKRKTEDMDGSGDSLQCISDKQEGDRSIADDPKKFAIFPKATIEYLNSWIYQHADNPFPDTRQKTTIMADTGLTKQQVGDWMARKRMKLRKGCLKNKSDLRTVNTTKVENLLLAKSPDQNNTEPHSKSAHVVVVPGNEKPQTSIKELEVYMKTWLSCPENACNLMPSLTQKEKIIQDTGIEKKRLEGWLFRARKRLNTQQEGADQPQLQVSQNPSIFNASTDQTSPSQGHEHHIPTNVYNGMKAESVIN